MATVAPQAHDAARMGELLAGARAFARRRRTPIAIVGSLAVAAALAFALAGRRDEFATALSDAALGVLAVAAALQVVVTGTIGGLLFVCWAGADWLQAGSRHPRQGRLVG